MFIYFNANPVLNIVGDCVVRAISVLTNRPWEVVGDQSYRRGRDAMGRYTSRDMMPQRYYDGGYSGHANKEDLKMDLRMMMENSKSDQERMAIQKVLDMWKE